MVVVGGEMGLNDAGEMVGGVWGWDAGQVLIHRNGRLPGDAQACTWRHFQASVIGDHHIVLSLRMFASPVGTGWCEDITGGAVRTAEPAVEGQQRAVQCLCQGNVPRIVAGQVASQSPYPLSKRREGEQFYLQPQQIAMGGGGFYARYFPTLLQPAQDVGCLDQNQLRTGQVAFGKR